MSMSRRRRQALQEAREDRERQMRAWAEIGKTQYPVGLIDDERDGKD